MKKMIVLFFLVWLAVGIFFYFQFGKIFTEQELAKSHLLAEVLTAKNTPFLQNGLEPLVSTKELLQWPGVRAAWFEDEQGKAITPSQNSVYQSGWIRIEKGLENGKAILVYQPKNFPFVRFCLAWLLPILIGVLFFVWRRRSKPNPISIPNNYPWLAPLAKLLGKKFHIFDSQGNILASAQPTSARHILDLFSNPEDSQHILKAMEGLAEHAGVGFWREANGERRFLVIS